MVFDAEQSARFDIDRQDFGGQAVQMRLRLPAGDHAIAVAIPRIFEGLPASRGGPNPRRGPNRRDASSARRPPRRPSASPSCASSMTRRRRR